MTSAWLLAAGGLAGLALLAAAARWHERSAEPRSRLLSTGAGWASLIVALVLFDLSVPQLVNSYVWQVIIKVGIYISLAVSLNIINGIAGQFSMGHAGFMAVGAYSAAYLTMTLGANVSGWARWLPWNAPWAALASWPVLLQLPWGLGGGILFLIALLAGGVTAAIAGYLVGIPSLRLRGDYLAIVTLGFGEIIRNLIANVDVIGASRGLPGVPHYSNLFWVFFFAAVAIFVSYRLLASGPGRAMLAVREDEIAAAAMGIDTTRTKIRAFAIGTFFAGIAGGLLGHHFEYLHPDYFKFDKSFEVIIMVVLGGMGSVSGAAIAAVVIALAPELLRYVKDVLGNLTDPAVLYGAAPFIVFSLLFLALFAVDILRVLATGAVRIVSALRMRSGRGPTHEDLVRLRRSAGRSIVSRIPAFFTPRRRAARNAGVGAFLGLGAAILHRALLGSSWDPRAEYWVLVIFGMIAGVLVGRRISRSSHEPAAPADSERRTVDSVSYGRLAAIGLLAPLAFLVAQGLEVWARDLLDRMSVVFREFPDPRMVLYSIMLIALMLTRPTGLFGSREVRDWWRQRRRHRSSLSPGGTS